MDESYLKRFLKRKIYVKTRNNNQYHLDVTFVGDGVLEGIDKFSKVVVINISDIEIIEGGQR